MRRSILRRRDGKRGQRLEQLVKPFGVLLRGGGWQLRGHVVGGALHCQLQHCDHHHPPRGESIADRLREAGFGVTVTHGEGRDGAVDIIP
ncbi:MAG UNVERIFIED_CONTAM: hypothetical protein LVT10_24395 [Anaerolineae bacterium]